MNIILISDYSQHRYIKTKFNVQKCCVLLKLSFKFHIYQQDDIQKSNHKEHEKNRDEHLACSFF